MPIDVRPQSLDEMIGQEALRRKARIACGAALKRNEPLPHVMLTSAGGGLGKTTLAQVLANEMYVPLVSTTGQCLASAVDLRNVVIRLKPNSMLLVDEFHGLGYLAAEELLLVLEQGVLNVNIGSKGPVRMPVTPFTLIASTTKASSINGPLRQRFGLSFHFDLYSNAEIAQMVCRMAEPTGLVFDETVCHGIAQRAQGVPRKALRLVERVRDVAQARGVSNASKNDLEMAMRLEGIDHLGLVPDERRILETLAQSDPRPVSARSLALVLGTELATFTDVLEPALVRLGLMVVGAGGRRITDRGLAHLASVESQ